MVQAYSCKKEYGISTILFGQMDLYSALKSIADFGFESAELWADNIHFDTRTGIDIKLVRKWLKELKMTAHSVHAPFTNFKKTGDVQKDRKFRQEILLKTIDACSDLPVPIMVVHGLDRIEYNYMANEVDIVRDSLAELCEYGRKQGVMIALENLTPGKGDTESELRCRLRDFTQYFFGIGLKYCLDIGHAVLNGSDIFDEIDAAGKDLITFHVHNNDGQGDNHNIPSKGVINWPVIYDYARSKGFTDTFILEPCFSTEPLLTMKDIASLFN
ncbi:xylose isomerase [Spirochaetia bacterium]|nr:xylose isomerase [Spirochaetia bacterium]